MTADVIIGTVHKASHTSTTTYSRPWQKRARVDQSIICSIFKDSPQTRETEKVGPKDKK